MTKTTPISPPVISIVGWSGAGKTTLIERLVPLLKAKGLKIGVIKLAAHEFEIDHPGKDSYRHFHAGSDVGMIVSAGKLALVRRSPPPLTLEQLVSAFMNDMDLVLVEGNKSGAQPKIEVFRRESGLKMLPDPEHTRIALVTDAEEKLGCPTFDLDDMEGLAEFIMANFAGKPATLTTMTAETRKDFV